MASTGPSSLLSSARTAVLKATGIDQSKDVLPTLNLPRCVVEYLTKTFKSSDFFVNKDDVTPEEVDIGLYKAVCKIDQSVVLLKVIDPKSLDKDELSQLSTWKSFERQGVQRCLTSFNEDGKIVFVLQHFRRVDDIIRQCRQQQKKLSESYIWSLIHETCSQLSHFQTNNLPYEKLQPHKIGHLINGDIVVQNGILNQHDEITSAAENMILEDDNPAGVYSPSEIINEEDPSEKTLVWQVGALGYELAALRPAYQVEDANDVFTSLGEIMEGNLPPPLEGYTTELCDVISRCLSLSGDDRPSLSELVELSVNKCDANAADNLVAVLQK